MDAYDRRKRVAEAAPANSSTTERLAREAGILHGDWEMLIGSPATFGAFADAVLEMAAKECDNLQGRQATLGRAYAVVDCAAAVRALKG